MNNWRWALWQHLIPQSSLPSGCLNLNPESVWPLFFRPSTLLRTLTHTNTKKYKTFSSLWKVLEIRSALKGRWVSGGWWEGEEEVEKRRERTAKGTGGDRSEMVETRKEGRLSEGKRLEGKRKGKGETVRKDDGSIKVKGMGEKKKKDLGWERGEREMAYWWSGGKWEEERN